MEGVIQRVAAKAVVVNEEGKVLIVRETGYEGGTNIGKYVLPGGRIEPGEKLLDGLWREVQEECGLEIVSDGVVHVDEWFPTTPSGKLHIVGIFFLCRVETKNVVVELSDEHDAYEWINPAQHTQFDILVEDRRAIQAVTQLNNLI